MKIGISTACFYPLETSKALQSLQDINVKSTEIFLNTFSEATPQFTETLNNQIKTYDLEIKSLHPFSSFLEPYFFYTNYKARIDDGISLYKKQFETAKQLGAKIFVYHGNNKKYNETTFEFDCQIYKRLRNIAKDYGLIFCQENVARCKTSDEKSITKMRDILHDDVDFVLDTKQAHRLGISFDNMYNAMKGKIQHMHISDYTSECDCVLPFQGKQNFDKIKNALILDNYQQDIMIEVYSNAFNNIKQLEECYIKLNNFFKQ